MLFAYKACFSAVFLLTEMGNVLSFDSTLKQSLSSLSRM
ncbi:hypothetical protein Lser_V15G32026 [Lactuca serriola]